MTTTTRAAIQMYVHNHRISIGIPPEAVAPAEATSKGNIRTDEIVTAMPSSYNLDSNKADSTYYNGFGEIGVRVVIRVLEINKYI